MQIAVVVPALDEAERIEAAIASALENDVEAWVVDGGSRDGTPECARRAGARVVASPAGRARQLAVGLEAAGGDVVLFLHADTRLPRGFAADVRRALEDPSVVGGAFRLRFDERSAALRVVEWGARWRSALSGLAYGDQAVFARRSVLHALGGIPQAPIMEDLDLVKALKKQGRFVLLPRSVVTSARRYRARGVLRTWLRNSLALLAWGLDLDREGIAAWYRR